MLWLACLWLALNDGSGNTIRSKKLQSAVCILPLVYRLHFTLSLYFTPHLQSVFYTDRYEKFKFQASHQSQYRARLICGNTIRSKKLQSAVCILPLVYRLHFTLSLYFTPRLQSMFYTDRYVKFKFQASHQSQYRARLIFINSFSPATRKKGLLILSMYYVCRLQKADFLTDIVISITG